MDLVGKALFPSNSPYLFAQQLISTSIKKKKWLHCSASHFFLIICYSLNNSSTLSTIILNSLDLILLIPKLQNDHLFG